MSTVIEEKVVSMEFDNQHFEKNVKTSMSTIDKLKQKLNFGGMANGLQGLGDVAKKIDMGPLSDGIETVRAKFSAMQIMGITALQSITNSAINYGKRIVSSLTIDPVKTGLQEYETQIGAIQTILANTESKGTTLEEVNAALDELNLYADKTIYNFTQMTKNIGTFTAAGVELDTSVSAIKGIANLAAVSGSTSQQASTAMYQLSQALAAGKIRLMDWNSVVNAGMGGQVFQDAIKETARVHGVAIDDMIKNEGSFRETLKNDWFTAEILTETLSKFTGDLSEAQLKSMGYNAEQIKGIMKLGETANDAATKVKTYTQLMETLKESAQSGWSQTWRTIVGDFEESKELWTGVSDALGGIIGRSAEARNKVLSAAFDSGWKKLLGKGVFDEDSYLYQIEESAKTAGKSLDELKKKYNGKFTSDALREAIDSGLINSDIMSNALNNLSSLYSAMGSEQLKKLGFTEDQVKTLAAFNEQIQNGSISMLGFVNEIKKISGRDLLIESFKNIYHAIGNIVKPIKEAFNEIFGFDDAEKVADKVYKLLEAFKNFTDHLKLSNTQMENLKRTFKGVFAVVDIFLMGIKAVGSIITKVLDMVFGLDIGILSVTGSIGDFFVKVRDFIKGTGSLEKFINGAVNGIKKLIDGVKSFLSSVKEKIKFPAFESFSEFLAFLWDKIKLIGGKIGEGLGNIFSKLGQWIADFVNSIGSMDFEKLFDNIVSILIGGGIGAAGTGIFMVAHKISEIISGFTGLLKDSLEGFKDAIEQFSDKATLSTLMTVAVAIGLLVASVALLSSLDQEAVRTGVTSLVTLIIMLTAATAILSKIEFTKTIKNISSKNKKGGMFRESVTELNKSAGVLITLAGTVALLAVALKVLSTMKPEEIAVGLAAMTVMLGGLLLATSFLSKIKFTKTSTRALNKLLMISGALALVTLSLKFLATMDWQDMGVSLISMLSVFTILLSTVAIISKIKITKANRVVSKMLALTGVLALTALSLKLLSTIDWQGMGVSLISMASAFIILTSVIAIISKIKFNKAFTATSKMVALSGAFAIMAVSLKVLSTMNWQGMGISLISMTVALGALLGAVAIISKAKLSAGLDSVLSLYGIAGALLIMAGSIKLLSTIDWKGMGVALISLTATVGLVALLLTALKFITIDLKNLLSLITIAGSMIALAGALKILAPALTTLQTVNWETIGKAGAILAGLMVVLVGLGLLMSTVKWSALAVPVLAVSLLMLAPALSLLANGLKQLGEALKPFGWHIVDSLAVLTAVIVILAGLGSAMGALASVTFGGSIWGPVLIVALLAMLGPALILFAESMTIFANKLAEATGKLKRIKFWDICTGIFKAAVVIVAGVALLLGSVAAFSALSTVLMISVPAMLLMATTLAILGVALALFSNTTTNSAKAVVNAMLAIFEALPKMILLLGDAIVALCKVIVKAAPEIGKALLVLVKTTMDSLVQAIPDVAEGIFQILASILETASKYAEELAVLLFDFIVKVLKVLETYIPEFVEIGINMLVKFLEALSDAMNSLTPEDMEGLMKAVSKLGIILGMLALLQPLITRAISSVLGLGILVAEIALILWGIGKLTEIPGLMEAVSDSGTLIKSINGTVKMMDGIIVLATLLGVLAPLISTAQIAVLSLGVFIAELTAVLAIIGGISRIPGLNEVISDGGSLLQNIGSAIGKFVGGVVGGIGEGLTSALPQMATDLSTFMTNLTPFLNGIKMVDESVIEKTAALSKSLLTITGSNLLNQITNWLSDGNSMSTFSAQLVEFGNGIKGFNDAVAGITPETVTAAAEAGKLLGQMAKSIPTTGGLWDYIAGSNDLSGFAGQISKFGDGIAAFGTATEGVTKDSILAAAEAGKLLGEMAKSIPTSGGLWDKLFGSDDLSGFASQLQKFGDGIMYFSTAVAGVSAYKADAIAAAELGKTLSNTIGSNGLLKSAANTSVMAYFTLTVKAYANAIKSFGEAMNGVDFDSIRKGAEVGKTLAESMKIAAVNSTKIASEAFGTTAKQIFTSFGKSIVQQMPGAQTAVKTVFKGVSSAIKATGSSLLPEFRTIGVNLVQGFSNGIQNGITTVKNAAVSMATTARDAIRSALRIFSPSRVAFEDGSYFVEGFVNALVVGLKGVFNASTDIADVAVEGISSAIKQINSVIENGIDTNPTIKPIMDLSDLRSGASAIDRMFGMSPSLGVLANAQGINYAMNNRQNGGNGEVISAIRDLKETIKDSYGGISIGDINYNPGSEIDDAVKALIRAITNEGRI